jgi:hypothetical protein
MIEADHRTHPAREDIMRTHHTLTALLAGGALVALLPMAAAGQTAVGQPAPAVDTERAQHLEAEAWGLLSCGSPDYRKAARLFQQAAAARGPDDREALRSLEMAGRLAHYGNDLRRSRAAMVQRAERALRLGEVHEAADAYIDAAFVAVEIGDGAAALGYAESARLLSGSPLLSVAERHALSQRLGEDGATVATGPGPSR